MPSLLLIMYVELRWNMVTSEQNILELHGTERATERTDAMKVVVMSNIMP